MMLLGCLHPPGGAVALICVIGGPAVAKAGYRPTVSARASIRATSMSGKACCISSVINRWANPAG